METIKRYSRLLSVSVAAAVMIGITVGVASGQTKLDSYTFTSAGGDIEAGSLSLIVAVGQDGPVGTIESAPSLSIDGGFLSTLGPGADVQAPTISNSTAPNTSDEGSDVAVSVDISDNNTVSSATLSYRMAGSSSFSDVAMTPSGGTYQANIPAGSVTARGVEFFIEASDEAGNTARQPTAGVDVIRVSVGGEGLVNSSAQPAGTTAAAYRLVSVPLELTSRSPGAVFADDFGAYDSTQWRFFALRPDQSYAEYMNVSTIAPGMGYWLILRSSGKNIDTGIGKSFVTDEAFSVAMNAGWTFVGNPFAFDVPFSKLALESGEALDIRSYSGSWNDASSPMRPFVGYAVTNETQTADRLMIDPAVTPAKAPSRRSLAERLAGLDWSLAISSSVGDARDADNLLGVSSAAEDEWDVLDRPEPPVIGDYITLYFPHEDWSTTLKRYRTDVRTVSDQGNYWKVRVETPISGEVSLVFDGIATIPAEYDVWLVDSLIKSRHNLREINGYTYVSDGRHPRDLALVVGVGDFVRKTLDADGLIPDRFELDQNFPNPFNPTTTIRYGLPEPTEVSLVVFDLLGRRVSALLDGVEQKEGYHAAIWDGRNLDGSQAASGVYVYQLRIGDQILSRKMLLVK